MASIDASRRIAVLIDADVLHRANVRDVLLRVASRGLFRPHWSVDILNEVAKSLEGRGYTTAQTCTLNKAMDAAFTAARITGHKRLIDGLQLPDANDRHVLAAAITGRCDVIVTFNLDDFPSDALTPFGIEALHPDAFLMSLLAIDRDAVLVAVRGLLAALVNPPIPFEAFVAGLRAQHLAQFGAQIEKARDLLEP